LVVLLVFVPLSASIPVPALRLTLPRTSRPYPVDDEPAKVAAPLPVLIELPLFSFMPAPDVDEPDSPTVPLVVSRALASISRPLRCWLTRRPTVSRLRHC
jgi:hypothetical protein